MKIINIVENLDKGAVENWLVNIFLESRKLRPGWEWTFYCILGKEGRLDEKVKSAGGKIIYSSVTISNKWAFLKNLRKVLTNGHYDIIHSHHDYLSGFYLLASIRIKFWKRILQVHNTDKALPVGNKLLHKILLNPFRNLSLYFSNYVIGISENTLDEFAGSGWRENDKFQLLYYGVDLDRFNNDAGRLKLRKELDLPDHSRILLFAGRMIDLKNPDFVVDILSSILKKRKDIYAVFVGKGDREPHVRKKAEELGISDNIRMLGWHDNIPFIMKSSDAFVFPRLEYPKEGLGLVVIEAQAAGLPMFITSGIVKDAVVINELAYFNNLDDSSVWADQIEEVLDKPHLITQEQALERMKQSKFELHNATKNLISLYER